MEEEKIELLNLPEKPHLYNVLLTWRSVATGNKHFQILYNNLSYQRAMTLAAKQWRVLTLCQKLP